MRLVTTFHYEHPATNSCGLKASLWQVINSLSPSNKRPQTGIKSTGKAFFHGATAAIAISW